MAGALSELGFATLLAWCALVFGGLTIASVGLGFLLERVMQARGRRIFAVSLERKQLGHELLGNGFFLVVFVPATAALLDSGILRFGSGWLAQSLSFGASFFVFQVFYYGLHRAMHSRALFRFHRWHHASLVTTPMTGLSMSPVEAIGWTVGMLAPALALSSVGLLAFEGYLAFFAFHWLGNIAGHANAELFPQNATRAMSLAGNPITYHSLHHARFDGHYGFGSALMDRLFGTEWPDWIPLVQRVASGTPLQSLRERGDDVTPEPAQPKPPPP